MLKIEVIKKFVIETSIIKTVLFNFRYFGWGGVFKCYALIGKSTKLAELGGRINAVNPHFGCIRIGYSVQNTFDVKYERAIFCNTGILNIKDEISFGQGTRLANSGEITFGKDFRITANSSLICRKQVIFGDNVLISWETLIMDTDFHKIYKYDCTDERVNEDKEIRIGDHVWVGCRNTILKGSIIAPNTVISAGNVITGVYSVPNSIIAGGNRLLKENVTWVL